MSEHDNPGLQHFPLPMRPFGVNEYGDSLYRIVLASSVRHLVGGEWPDGSRGYQWVQRYRQIQTAWILERWSMPQMSRFQWESMTEPLSGWPVLGPYPTRGEYNLVWEFDAGVDSDGVGKIVAFVERSRFRSFDDVRQKVKAEYAMEEKDQKRQSRDEITDCLMAFGTAPISYGRFGRGTKTAPELRTAEECGLPVPHLMADTNELRVSSTLLAGR